MNVKRSDINQPFTSMRCSLFILSLISFSSFGQRIGLDISTRFSTGNLTLTYHQIIQSKYLISGGVFIGGSGSTTELMDTSTFDSGSRIRSPYSSVNNLYKDSLGDYELMAYGASGQFSGFHFALGYFKQFNPIHSIRFHLNSKWGVAVNRVHAFYRSNTVSRTEDTRIFANHWAGSVGLEVFHGIRLNDRLSLNYGVKLPYFISINPSLYTPKKSSDLYYGLKPELSFGCTYFIGKCD